MFTNHRVALPVRRTLRGRRLIAVDIENMVGGAVLNITHARAAWAMISPELDLLGDEQIVVGVSHISALDAWRARPDARLVVRSGKDGADLALLDVLDGERVEERFDEVVIVTGDGIFSDSAERLGRLGVHVTIVGIEGHVSRALRMAAARVILLPESDVDLGEAA